MFSFNTCKVEGCRNFVISGKETCLQHCEDPQKCQDDILKKITSKEPQRSLSLEKSDIQNYSLQDIKLYACNLSGNLFVDCDFSQSFLQMVFFEFSKFIRCTFNDIMSKYCVFSGCEFIECDFSGSDILHTNFIGSFGKNCNFNDSDLYYSNFTKTHLIETTFNDCNLKKTDFSDSIREQVSFKYSNFEEALFTRGK
ncbi:MAG: pentapeptide repeat-containing protein [Spirochaetia bacterium]|nr:pentapeptide repeat-containing protein [Spirochaetia bacterium]